MNICLLMMGGVGSRFGADIPKQYVLVDGRPIFVHLLEKLNKFDSIDRIIIVSHQNWIDYVNQWVKDVTADKVVDVISGGSTRSDSVKNGLIAASAYSSENDLVLIHDVTHPYLDKSAIEDGLVAARTFGAATLGAPQCDTCYQKDTDGFVRAVIPRQEIVSAGSPEIFKFGLISDLYLKASQEELDRMTCAGALALEHGICLKVIPMSYLNLKITYQTDMELFKKLINNYFFQKED